jgi:ADP-L-glycero-D-manno-heptose 6-epimerase
MYIVTGGAGFIGSHICMELNQRGITDILVVDSLAQGDKFINLADAVIADYMDAEEFLDALTHDRPFPEITAVLHQGACTDTMEQDGRFMMRNNFTFSKHLFEWCVRHKVPMVYASSAAVYGAGTEFEEIPRNERPLNVYGYSKLAFDQYVRAQVHRAAETVVGLRYFNVYGPRETQKGRMASMVYQLYHQVKRDGKAKLFTGTDGYGDGDQRRDFVFVGDVVNINLHFAHAKAAKGIFNVGTGQSRSFNDVARRLIELHGSGQIEYIPFNQKLSGKYQSFTEADLTNLRKAGYTEPFTSLENGVEKAASGYWEFDIDS